MRLLLLVLLIILSNSLHSDEKPIIVGIDELDYFPIIGKPELTSNKGIINDIIVAFLVYDGKKFRIVRLPTARLRRDFYTGKSDIDLIIPDNKKWGTKPSNLIFSDLIYGYTEGTIVLDTSHVESVSDIKLLGIPDGFSPYPYKDYILSGKIKIYENKSQYLIEQLSLARIDAVYMSVDVSRYYSNLLGVKTTYVTLLPHSSDYYYASTIHRKDLIVRLNAFISTKHATILLIEKKYFNRSK